jgi:hypothetical protein
LGLFGLAAPAQVEAGVARVQVRGRHPAVQVRERKVLASKAETLEQRPFLAAVLAVEAALVPERKSVRRLRKFRVLKAFQRHKQYSSSLKPLLLRRLLLGSRQLMLRVKQQNLQVILVSQAR